VEPRAPRPLCGARRNDLDTDEWQATINGEEGTPYAPRRDALSGSRHIVYFALKNCSL